MTTIQLIPAAVLATLCACAPAAVIDPPCRCLDGAQGTYTCQQLGGTEVCRCRTGEEMCLNHALEDCDGLDNDGNGVVDEGEVCADASVANTTPFAGGVYFQGTTRESSCGFDAVQRFWPTLATTYAGGFGCTVDLYRFRRSDGGLYFHTSSEGLRRDVDGPDDPVVATSSCTHPGLNFDFDASNTLYYQCGDTVRKGDGAMVTAQVDTLAGTLDDGRVIVARYVSGGDGTEFIVVDGNGTELSRLSPFKDFSGSLIASPLATTVAGNRAYVVYLREYPTRQTEIVVFGVDESSTWRRVRRVPVVGFGRWQLALSDGSVFVREADPLMLDNNSERIVVYLPDGTSEIAWLESAQQEVRAHAGEQLLVGPP